MTKKIIYSIIGIIFLVAVLFGVWQMTSSPQTQKPQSLPLVSTDHIKGKKDAKTVLIEYSDFQCPACKAYQPIVKQITDAFKDKIAIVYRHFPLPQHQNATKAAYAAEAAGVQGKFWEMHNLLFEKQDEWSNVSDIDELFLSYAKQLKLNEDQFKKDRSSPSVENKVQTDLASGQKREVNATPSFFLNGEKLDNPSSFEQFKKQIEAIVQKFRSNRDKK